MTQFFKAGLLRMAALATSAALAGCSALQIDVDVYKGALNHEPDIQAQQYAALAMAAKPVLATLRNRLHHMRRDLISQQQSGQNKASAEAGSQGLLRASRGNAGVSVQPRCADGSSVLDGTLPAEDRNRYSCRVKFSDDGTFYINGLLSFYEDTARVDPTDDWDRARAPLGLITLFNRLQVAARALAKDPSNTRLQREHQFELGNMTESLIPFAERILFVVNNPSVFSDDNYRIERAILQTLGNSLILHANDLRRRQAHDANQQMRFDAQRRAAEPVTAAQGPAVLLDQVARQVAESKGKAAVRASAASAAVDAARLVQEKEAKAAQTAATDLQKAEQKLKTWKHPQPAVALAFVTLVDPLLAADVPAAEQDQAALVERAAKFKAGETVTARALADDLLAWVTQERDPKLASGQRQKRIEGLARALHRTEPLVSLRPVAAGPAPQVLAGIAAATTKAFADANALAQQTRQPLVVAQQQAQENDTDAKARSAKAVETLTAAQNEHTAAATASGRADKAHAAISAALPAVAAEVAGGASAHPEAVRQMLQARLNALDAKTFADADKAAARAALAALTLQPAFSFRAGDFDAADETHGNRKTAMQVLEDLIAYLRTRRTAVLADKGDGEEAQNLAKAIESAEQQRTDQVFLRPASDYLRNVYASTALADETRPANRNMLLDYIRNLNPNSEKDNMGLQRGNRYRCELKAAMRDADGPAADDKDCDPGRDIEKARADLEKLFWQNINRVTTNGGTNANHVIAKDDVGNWYIKTFSIEPKEVFESAKSLLLFNQGGKIDSNLLRRAELRDLSRNGTTEEKSAANTELGKLGNSPAGLAVGGRAQKRFQDRYADETKQLALALPIRIAGLPGKELTDAWALALPDATQADQRTALVSGATRLQSGLAQSLVDLESQVKQLTAQTTHPAVVGNQLITVLDRLMRYRDDLVVLAQAQTALAGVDNASRLKAVNDASRQVVNRLIEEVVQQRQRTVDSYQEGLASIADTVR